MAGSDGLSELGDKMDATTFQQILEMDEEDDDREFSKSIVYGFFDQAETTFQKMDEEIKSGNLKELSALGHYLKGSSAIIGLNYIKASCEKIQHWGHEKDEIGQEPESATNCLRYIRLELDKMRQEYSHVERALRKFYGES